MTSPADAARHSSSHLPLPQAVAAGRFNKDRPGADGQPPPPLKLVFGSACAERHAWNWSMKNRG